nr:PTS sugar transporter subunit IIA [Alkalicoccus halolimnae]
MEVKLIDQMSEDLINTQLEGTTQEEIIEEMMELFAEDNAINSKADFKKAILEREAQASTGIGHEVAVPHGQSDAVIKPGVAFGIVQGGVDWHSHDGAPVKLIFMVAAPEGDNGEEHLRIMQMIASKLRDEDFRKELLKVKNFAEAYELLKEIE